MKERNRRGTKRRVETKRRRGINSSPRRVTRPFFPVSRLPSIDLHLSAFPLLPFDNHSFRTEGKSALARIRRLSLERPPGDRIAPERKGKERSEIWETVVTRRVERMLSQRLPNNPPASLSPRCYSHFSVIRYFSHLVEAVHVRPRGLSPWIAFELPLFFFSSLSAFTRWWLFWFFFLNVDR